MASTTTLLSSFVGQKVEWKLQERFTALLPGVQVVKHTGKPSLCARRYSPATSAENGKLPFVGRATRVEHDLRVRRRSGPSCAPGAVTGQGRDLFVGKAVKAGDDLGLSRHLHDLYDVPAANSVVPLGMGSYGVVTKIKDKKNDTEYALKSIPKVPPNKREQKSPKAYLQKLVYEIKVMQHVGPSLNVVYLYDAFEDDTHVHLVLEYCRGGELWRRIRKGKYTEAYAASTIRSILRVVAQCHAKNVIYRDIKPDNFLFLNNTQNSPLKATDFGLATYFRPGEVLTRRCGTPSYLAPEVVKRAYGPEADNWSAGVTVYQLLSGRLPFRDKQNQRGSIKEVLRAVVEDRVVMDDEFWLTNISEGARDLTARLLDRDPMTRLTAQEALEHPWVKVGGDALDTPLAGSVVQRLQRNGTFPLLKRIVLRSIAPLMLQEDAKLGALVQASELYKIFREFDVKDTGQLTLADMQKGLDAAGYSVEQAETEQLIKAMDLSREGVVHYDEFLAVMIDWVKVEQYDSDRYHEVVDSFFNTLQDHREGWINRKDIGRLICQSTDSDEMCELMVDKCMDEADSDGDGVISREDFWATLHTGDNDVLDQYDDRCDHGDMLLMFPDQELVLPDEGVVSLDGEPLRPEPAPVLGNLEVPVKQKSESPLSKPNFWWNK